MAYQTVSYHLSSVGFNAAQDIIGHFGDESFQAIDCTGTDNQKQGKNTTYTLNTKKIKKLP